MPHRGRGVAKFKTKILHRFYPIDFRPCIQRVLRRGVLNRRIFNQRIGNFAKFLFSKAPKTLLGAECLSTQGKEFWLDARRALNDKNRLRKRNFFWKKLRSEPQKFFLRSEFASHRLRNFSQLCEFAMQIWTSDWTQFKRHDCRLHVTSRPDNPIAYLQ